LPPAVAPGRRVFPNKPIAYASPSVRRPAPGRLRAFRCGTIRARELCSFLVLQPVGCRPGMRLRPIEAESTALRCLPARHLDIRSAQTEPRHGEAVSTNFSPEDQPLNTNSYYDRVSSL